MTASLVAFLDAYVKGAVREDRGRTPDDRNC